MRLKRVIASLLLIVTMVTVLPPQQVSANITGDENEGAGGSGAASGGYSGTGFTQETSGFRFYIVDNKFNRVSKVLDLVYEDPANYISGNRWYKNGSNEKLSSGDGDYSYRTFKWLTEKGTLPKDNVPKRPLVATEGIYQGTGDDFRRWMLDGLGGSNVIQSSAPTSNFVNPNKTTPNVPKKTGNITQGTNGSGSSGGGGGGNSGGSGSSSRVTNKVVGGYRIYSNGKVSPVPTSDAIGNNATRRGFKSILEGQGSKPLGSWRTYSNIVMEQYRKLMAGAGNIKYTFIDGKAVTLKGNADACLYYAYTKTLAKIANGSRGYSDSVRILTEIYVYENIFGGRSISAVKNSAKNHKPSRPPINELKEPTDNINIVDIDGVDLSQTLALASGGYVTELLNAKDSKGNYLLQFTKGDRITNDDCARIMGANDYSLVVEPVIWFKPYLASWGAAASYYIYGTIRNITDFFITNLNYDRGRPVNRRYLNDAGWSSLVVGDTIEFDGLKIVKPTFKYGAGTTSDNVTFRQIKDKAMNFSSGTVQGMAMHVYRSKPSDDWTKTRRDEGQGKGVPHSAPSKDNVPNKAINIVKVYEDKSGDQKTFITKDAPTQVYILNEKPRWTVEEWIIGRDMSADSNTSWSKIKSTVYSSREDYGTTVPADRFTKEELPKGEPGGQRVTLRGEGNSKVLYVYLKETGNLSVNNDISESQISNVREVTLSGFGDFTNTTREDYGNILLNKVYKKRTGSNTRYNYTIYRGDDHLTIADYEGIGLNAIEREVAGYSANYRHGNTPGEGRQKSNYIGNYVITYGNNVVNGSAGVKVYSGTAGGGTTNTSVPAVDSSNKIRVSSGQSIGFFPFVWMTKATIGSNGSVTHERVKVLGEYLRTVQPNDYAEVVHIPGELLVKSNLWASDKMVVDKMGSGTTLKGGASYRLENTRRGQIIVTTMQTVMDGLQANNSLINGTRTTIGDAVANQDSLAGSILNDIDGKLTIDHYVNTIPSDPVSRGGVKVGPGANISALMNGSNYASTLDKYYLKHGLGDHPRSLDTSVETEYEQIFHSIFATPEGIFLLSSNSAEDNERDIKKYIASNGKEYTNATKIMTRGSTVAGLVGTSKRIEDRTQAISKLQAALEIGKGNDPSADWASGGKWYSEGTLGITILEQNTTISVGFNKPTMRGTILDPKLIPKVTSKGDQNTRFFSSQYIPSINGSSVVSGEFKGKTISLNVENIMKPSQKFYITNSTVLDGR